MRPTGHIGWLRLYTWPAIQDASWAQSGINELVYWHCSHSIPKPLVAGDSQVQRGGISLLKPHLLSSRVHNSGCAPVNTSNYYYYFASAAVTVDSSHMTASSSASWSRFTPRSNFVNGHVSTTRFMVCRWPQSQEGDWVRPHLCKNRCNKWQRQISPRLLTLTGDAVFLIFPHEMASSGRAPESEPSNSCAVLTYTQKSVPFLCQQQQCTTYTHKHFDDWLVIDVWDITHRHTDTLITLISAITAEKLEGTSCGVDYRWSAFSSSILSLSTLIAPAL